MITGCTTGSIAAFSFGCGFLAGILLVVRIIRGRS